MLIQFSVENFMSFKNEAILSLSPAPAEKNHDDTLLSFNLPNGKEEKVLPMVGIYGANAAGKSNILKAVTASVLAIRGSSGRQADQKINGMIPFKFDDVSSNEPCHFDYIFTVNNKKYQYGFAATEDKVIEEYLYVYKSASRSMIFERTDVDNFKFTSRMERKLRPLVDRNTDNKLFLATATTWNSKVTADPYAWFSKGIDVYNSATLNSFFFSSSPETNEDLKKFLLDELKVADFNIKDYNVTSRDVANLRGLFPHSEGDNASQEDDNKKDTPIKGKAKVYQMDVEHEIVDEDGKPHTYKLPIQLESSGTERMLFIGSLFWHTFNNEKTILIDEFTNSLHPKLTKFLLDLFNSHSKNKMNSQLIFSTHDVSILSLDNFRRDEVYFVDKNARTGVSDLYSLSDYSPRKSENIRKRYLVGRYGAIPNIDEENPLW
jgi:AAA15 family ATPase/GTPase